MLDRPDVGAAGLIQRVVRVVCSCEGVDPADVYGTARPRRDSATDRARHLSAYVSHVSMSLKTSVVAGVLRKDETTLRNSFRKVEEWRDDAAFDDYLSLIESEVRVGRDQAVTNRVKERIVAAALKIGEVVYSVPRPGRHHTIMHALARSDERHWLEHGLGREEQGFLTSEGRFVDRMEAALIAVSAGQAKASEVSIRGNQLFSEEVW